MTQEALPGIMSDRVYRNDREAWELHEALYSRPEYVWPLRQYLSDVAGRATLRSREMLAGRWAYEALLGPMVEPCVGGGAIVDGMRRYAHIQNVMAGDVRDVENAQWIGDWAGEMGQWHRRDAHVPYLSTASLVITNPPFTRAMDIVEASWQRCPSAVVAILQRATWYEPTKKDPRGPWLRKHNPDQITIGRCEFFWPDGTSRGDGDSCSYTWYVWGPDRQGLRNGHHEIIPWQEAPQ